MDKQKQIEEMKTHIKSALSGVLEIEIDKLAEELLKHYQPKIPENAVVMTETERITMCVEQWDKGYNRARKVTAKKFAERAKEEAFCVFMGEPIIRASKVDEICKEMMEGTNENQ